ncbi:MAG TPA: GNAT family N-acetyltransferase [Steroidobacteraceae bacterium]|nr:GNAT family N-acetyltransferase [Steroidobacteraceae bacterium]
MKRSVARSKTHSRLPRRKQAARESRAAAPRSAKNPQAGERADAFVVRAAERADVAAVTALDERITGLAKSAHWLELYDRQKKAGQHAGIFLVAIGGGAPVRLFGFIVGEIRAWEFGSAPCGWVYALSVDPGSRLQGVGEALLETMAEEFRAAGIAKMRTMVSRDNLLPMLFFRGEGMMAGPYIQLEKDLT